MQMKYKLGTALSSSVTDYLNPHSIPDIYWAAHPALLQFHCH